MIRIPKAPEQVPYSQLDEAEHYAREELDRRARKSLRAFTMATFPSYDMHWHHKRMCEALMRWVRGETPFLIISMPPRHGKSELASKRLPAFIHGIDPDGKIIGCSYGAELASRINRDVQRIIDSPAYRRIFPGTQLSGARVKTVGDGKFLRNSTEYEVVNRKGYYRAAGIGGAVTGMGAGYLIIDDPVKSDKEADSETYREGIWNWFQATASTRLEKGGRILMIMTRWHEDDLAGKVLAAAKADPNFYQFEELRLDAIREEEGNPLDPRALGEALWPQMYSVANLRTKEASLGPRWWNSLYQQRPTALSGGVIKREWVKYYTTLPPTWHKQFQSWDATFKDNIGNDWVVGQVWGVYGRHKYLLDQVRARLSFTDTCKAIVDLSKKWPLARRKLVEEKANGAAILDTLKRDGFFEDGTKRPAITGLVPVNPDVLGSKTARLTACQTDFQAGDVLLPHPSLAPWVATNVDELVKFPNARYDDTADATSQALNDVSGGKSVLQKMTENL